MPFISTSFHYNGDEMPQELNSCLYQLADGRLGFVMCHMLFCWKWQNLMPTLRTYLSIVVFSLYLSVIKLVCSGAGCRQAHSSDKKFTFSSKERLHWCTPLIAKMHLLTLSQHLPSSGVHWTHRTPPPVFTSCNSQASYFKPQLPPLEKRAQ